MPLFVFCLCWFEYLYQMYSEHRTPNTSLWQRPNINNILFHRLANNESSEVIDILLPVTFILTLRPDLIMSKTSDDSLFATSWAGYTKSEVKLFDTSVTSCRQWTIICKLICSRAIIGRPRDNNRHYTSQTDTEIEWSIIIADV